MNVHRRGSRRHQRGLGTVAASLILLFALSMLVFYFNRHVLFEQRTAINQARAMQSQALAQGGLDWALTRLNDPRALQTACAFSGEGRARDLARSETLHAACRIDDAGLVACACALGTAPAVWPGDAPAAHGFAVQLHRHADDTQAVQINATGCVHAAEPCSDDAHADAHARLHVTAKTQPLLRRRPVATVTAGGTIQACAPASIANADSRTPGWWAQAGGAVASACASPASVSGVPGSIAASHGGDSVLAARAVASDTFFATWFGTPLAHYRAVACQAEGATPGVRGGEVRRLFNEGCRRFIVDDDIDFDADMTLGSADDPVALVLMARATFAGAATVHGLIYADAPEATASQWAQLRWRGAVVAHGAVLINSAVDAQFDDTVLQRLAERAAVMVAVPGSWRDE